MTGLVVPGELEKPARHLQSCIKIPPQALSATAARAIVLLGRVAQVNGGRLIQIRPTLP
jgi:hypothetical protein